MRGDERVLGLIPARGGSTGVPGKNLRQLGDKPLVAWPIDVARATDAVDRVAVSTDDAEIASVAREHGSDVIERPDHLATDDALVVDAVRHAIETSRADGEAISCVVMLEPTTPFRRPTDLTRCLELVTDPATPFDSAATFTEAAINPHRTWHIEDDRPEPFLDDATPWQPRQALPDTYQLNGAVYAFGVDAVTDEGTSLLFGEAGAVVMPPERSIDIDTELDFAIAETLLREEYV